MFERLFGSKTVDPAVAERIPPGQYKTEKFPVLHYGSVPHTDLATWDFKVWGEVDSPFTLTWAQFKDLPRKTVNTDIWQESASGLRPPLGGRAQPRALLAEPLLFPGVGVVVVAVALPEAKLVVV